MKKVTLILTCAGCGSRANFEKNKLLEKIDGQTVIERAFYAFYDSSLIDEYIITASKTDFDEFSKIFDKKAKIVLGGNTRSNSVKNALSIATGDIVLVHDGARPFVQKGVILDCIESVKKYRTGITAIPSVNTISKIDDNGFITQTVGKNNVVEIQTPQGFYLNDLKRAYTLAGEDDYPDESSVYLKFIDKPHVSTGAKSNVKLTYKEDFSTPLVGLDGNLDVRTGVGFDCHQLVEGRRLIIGGIEIKHQKGLLGHSDADVLLHAITDAVLSACALKDIGHYFPDNDEKFKDADSSVLLKTALDLIKDKGYVVTSVSAVIMAEKPKLSPYIDSIKNRIADIICIPVDRVGLSATTLEGLGFVGHEEGICSSATVVVKKI